MLRDLIAPIATCNIFWAPDFIYWRDCVDEIYSNKIDKIQNFGLFQGFNTDPSPIDSVALFTLKYFYSFNFF